MARTTLVISGGLLIVASPVIGAIPGPGGIFVFAGGLVLVLQNSAWARRNFVSAKRRWPRFGDLADRALRRRSARRRRDRQAEVRKASARESARREEALEEGLR